MSGWQVLLAAVCGLLVIEATDVCAWLAVRLVRWAARRRYAGDQDRVATRSEELTVLISDRPGQLFKLCTALGFTVAALTTAGGRRSTQRVGRRSIARARTRHGFAWAFGIQLAGIAEAFAFGRDVGAVVAATGLFTIAITLVVGILVFAAVELGVVDHADGPGRRPDGARVGPPRIWYEDADTLATPIQALALSEALTVVRDPTPRYAGGERRSGGTDVLLRFAWEGFDDDEGPGGW